MPRILVSCQSRLFSASFWGRRVNPPIITDRAGELLVFDGGFGALVFLRNTCLTDSRDFLIYVLVY